MIFNSSGIDFIASSTELALLKYSPVSAINWVFFSSGTVSNTETKFWTFSALSNPCSSIANLISVSLILLNSCSSAWACCSAFSIPVSPSFKSFALIPASWRDFFNCSASCAFNLIPAISIPLSISKVPSSNPSIVLTVSSFSWPSFLISVWTPIKTFCSTSVTSPSATTRSIISSICLGKSKLSFCCTNQLHSILPSFSNVKSKSLPNCNKSSNCCVRLSVIESPISKSIVDLPYAFKKLFNPVVAFWNAVSKSPVPFKAVSNTLAGTPVILDIVSAIIPNE